MKREKPLIGEDFEELYPGLSGILAFVTEFNRKRRRAGVAGGLILQLSNSTITTAAIVGDLVGLLSVAGGTGVYTFSILLDPSAFFAINGSRLEVGAALSAGTDAIIIQANNGAGSIVLGAFSIRIRSVSSYVPTYELLGF